MKLLKSLILASLLLFPLSAYAWMGPVMCGGGVAAAGGGTCTTPTGDEFTESFGEGESSCWTSGPSTCDHTWSILGDGGYSIADISSLAPPANTGCGKGLLIDGTADIRVSVNLPTTTCVANTLTLFVYFSSDSSLAAWSNAFIFIVVNGSNNYTSIRVLRDAGTAGYPTTMRVYGDSDFVDLTMPTADAWHTIVIALDSSGGTDASSVTVDGGTPGAFTRGIGDGQNIVKFESDGATGMKYYVGYFKQDTP